MDNDKVHEQQILETLRKNGVRLNPEKCEFHIQYTKYHGFIISPYGISMDLVKVEVVQNWNSPKNVKDVQAFLGFPIIIDSSYTPFPALRTP